MDICIFKKKPQDIPASNHLFFVSLLSYFLLTSFLVTKSETIDKAFILPLLEVTVVVLLTLFLLQIKNHLGRWTQTLTAMFGTGIVLSIFAIPSYLIIDFNQVDMSIARQSIAWFILSILTFWNIFINAHILRHALELRFFPALILAFVYLWLVITISRMIVPMEIN